MRCREVMQRHVDEGLALLDAAKSRFEARDAVFELDMAYVGQTHTVAVPLSITMEGGRVIAPTVAEEIEGAFDTPTGRPTGGSCRRARGGS
jgi:N-methylhydantoinase A